MSKRQISAVLLGFSLLLFPTGCKKKVPTPPAVQAPAPPAPAPPAKPSITFSAEPSTIERGQSASLRWEVTGATEFSIDNSVGSVQSSGTRQVYPTATTTYTLTATGPGGTSTATATVNVTNPPPPPPPPAPAPKLSLAQRLANEVQDAYFDYDKSDVREDARAILTKNADALKSILADFPGSVVTVEGHCDERGSAEYNLALGDRRATATKNFLVQLGVSADKLKTVSYGKERPACTESNEGCWQKNRRAHFSGE